jgi:AcrR family transcriptional regulator
MEARFQKLKPRPGYAGRRVEAHQRRRLHAATIDLVSRGGYESLSVTSIARTAGVANRTFYENFRGKEECFLATYDRIVRGAAREIFAAQHREQDLRAKVEAGFVAYLRTVTENPKAAYLALLDAPCVPGSAALIDHTTRLFESLVSTMFRTASTPVELPPLFARAIVGGLHQIANSHLLNGPEDHPSRDAARLADWVMSLGVDTADCISPTRLGVAVAVPPEPFPGNRPVNPAEDDRQIILRAVVKLATEEGYGSLSIPRIRSSAGISRRRFEEHFISVDECFLSALAHHADRIVSARWTPSANGGSWSGGVFRALTFVCRDLAEDSSLSNLLFGEVRNAGDKATRWRVDSIARLGSSLRASAPPESRPSALAAEASIAAVWSLLEASAAQGRAQGLAQLAGPAAYLILAPAIGAGAAVEVVSHRNN